MRKKWIDFEISNFSFQFIESKKLRKKKSKKLLFFFVLFFLFSFHNQTLIIGFKHVTLNFSIINNKATSCKMNKQEGKLIEISNATN